jgi:hypothetical protein
MRQGCISLGELRCDECHRVIPYLERYLVINEENGVEVEQGKTVCYCLDCCLQKGYAQYKKMEKEENLLTFFPD